METTPGQPGEEQTGELYPSTALQQNYAESKSKVWVISLWWTKAAGCKGGKTTG